MAYMGFKHIGLVYAEEIGRAVGPRILRVWPREDTDEARREAKEFGEQEGPLLARRAGECGAMVFVHDAPNPTA